MTIPGSVFFLSVIIVALNIITFFLFGYDKWLARTHSRRVPEKMLWLCALLGGSAGGLMGMHVFRHKTRKVSFQFVFALILLLQLGVLYFFFSGRFFVVDLLS